MNELYFIMENMLSVEYDIKSMLCLLKAIDKAYSSEEYTELKYIINMILKYLGNVEEELHSSINSLDKFIVADK